MFSTFRHYPIFELLFSNSPIALIITRNKQLKIYKVKPILGKFFFTEEGWFNIDQKYSLAHFKQRVYIYDATNINPIPSMLLKKIEKLSDSKQYNKFISQIEDIKKDDSPKDKETEDALETLTPVSNIDPTTLIALQDYAACDPQLLAVGTSHIMQIEKLLKKRSQSITASFPIKFIFIVIAVIMCIAVFSGDISLALDETFSKMGLNFGTTIPDVTPDVTPETIPEPTTGNETNPEIPDDAEITQ